MANLLVILAIVVLGLLLVALGIGLSRRAQRRTREISEQLGIPVEPPPAPPPRAGGTADDEDGDGGGGAAASTQAPTRLAPPARPRPGPPTPARPQAPPPPELREAPPEPLTIPDA